MGFGRSLFFLRKHKVCLTFCVHKGQCGDFVNAVAFPVGNFQNKGYATNLFFKKWLFAVALTQPQAEKNCTIAEKILLLQTYEWTVIKKSVRCRVGVRCVVFGLQK